MTGSNLDYLETTANLDNKAVEETEADTDLQGIVERAADMMRFAGMQYTGVFVNVSETYGEIRFKFERPVQEG